MRVASSAITVVFALSWAVAVIAAGQPPSDHVKTVRDGVYNKEQATRGRSSYDGKCGECHDGGSMGPELWGSDFLSRWNSKSVQTLSSLISSSMPADAPGSLSGSDVLDIVAYLLQANGFPPGDAALAASGLDTLMLVAEK